MLLVVVVVLVIIFWTAHDFKKAGAEVVNEKNIRKYLDYLVNDNGWTKSGGLIPTYTSPCGKKGCYADWERRIYAESVTPKRQKSATATSPISTNSIMPIA